MLSRWGGEWKQGKVVVLFQTHGYHFEHHFGPNHQHLAS
jgi:hypothetical protein